MSRAFAGVGTQFLRWNGASAPNGAWEKIAEINNINGPTMKKDTIDVTSLDSIGGYREFIGGFKDGGTVSFPMNFTHEGYLKFKHDFEDSENHYYQIVLPNAEQTSFEFEATVTELGTAIPADNKVTADVQLKVSGEVVIDSGSAGSAPAS